MRSMSEETAEKHFTQEQLAHALAIWAEYQTTHDVSARKGQAVGIDPDTGDVWFGEDILEIREIAY